MEKCSCTELYQRGGAKYLAPREPKGEHLTVDMLEVKPSR